MTRSFHKLWLKMLALIILSFAPLFFLATMSGTAAPVHLILDLLSWPVDGQPVFDAPVAHFLSALLSGFLAGWGVMVWCLAVWVYDAAPEAVRRSVLSGILVWFAVDSTGSVISGVPLNVLFNAGVLLLAVGPLWRPARD